MLLASTREAVRRHQLREEALFVPFAAVLQPVRQARRERSLHARRTHRAVQLRCQVLVEEAPTSRRLAEGRARLVSKMLAPHFAALAPPDDHIDVLDVLLGHEPASVVRGSPRRVVRGRSMRRGAGCCSAAGNGGWRACERERPNPSADPGPRGRQGGAPSQSASVRPALP